MGDPVAGRESSRSLTDHNRRKGERTRTVLAEVVGSAPRSGGRQEVHLEATEREITCRAAGLHVGPALGWPGRLGAKVGLVLLAVSGTYRPRIPLQLLNELPFLSDGRRRTT